MRFAGKQYEGWYFHPSNKYGKKLSKKEANKYLNGLEVSHTREVEDGTLHIWLKTFGLESVMIEVKEKD